MKKIAVLSFVLLLVACAEERPIIPPSPESVRMIKEVQWADYDRILNILSLKHQIGNDAVRDVFNRYLWANYQLTYNMLYPETVTEISLFNPKETVSETAIYFQGIEPSLVGALLFDIEIFLRIKNENIH